MCDLIFHGARSLYGEDCVDSTPADYMYDDVSEDDKHRCYGHGFNYAGLLPRIPIDRSNIGEKIQDHYYDLIVYGLGLRHGYNAYFNSVMSAYKKSEVILIDGNDDPYPYFELVERGLGLYFKRELVYPSDTYEECNEYFPLSYCIPKSQVITTPVLKLKKDQFVSLPNHKPYLFRSEDEYNKNYQKSMFALTQKKNGWDCFRHYEIVANGCVPVFNDYTEIPDKVMTTWDKRMLRDAHTLMWETNSKPLWMKQSYRDLAEEFTNQMLKRQTTEAAFEYILSYTNI